ncbi:hypothetical protein CfE428DRAFT_1433 [Chthoniobacter flavus Ellin428]|uniref:DUF4419 domain-containing protein n=1 Tax=Chthoniobacter flavus Ellin428 TaxID=497964 RepID=B4CXZ2_9BACT|nr:DUF4419 domain-containing protein [Chthoniobacter flavus]EDY21140.1 hypothetical protein CfE428DRAFT_1433 [Chthoniobacter flavus Ellin428]TCO87512.1 uncharacterized protein DUF4419 [Chthoniobacter flavus]
MNEPTTTFAVSPVTPATELLPELPYRRAIDFLLHAPLRSKRDRLEEQIGTFEGLTGHVPQQTADWLQSLRQKLAVVKAREADSTGAIEACSRYHHRLIAGVQGHPVVAALHHSFTDHRPLCLSPDMIWLLLCQGVAHHVNAQAEILRPQLVQHKGKLKIKVRRDEFIKGSPDNLWDGVIDEFSAEVREYIGTTHDLFLPRFSTTGANERLAAEIVLLDAVHSYFDYELETLCGIPAITLEGTPEDWQALAERAQAFSTFDLEWWLIPLQPVLQEFVAASRGEVRPTFWESIYKFQSISGGAAVTGWIAAFFPYFKDAQGDATEENAWLIEGGEKLQRLLAGEWDAPLCYHHNPSPGAFPSGLARAPFVWTYLWEELEMELLGGFVGVAQDQATLTLRPEIGWVIQPRTAPRDNPA